MKKLHFVALGALLGGCFAEASAFTVDNIIYDVLDANAKTATVTGAITTSDGVLTIPETVVGEDNETYKVTKINDSAFQRKTWLKKLVMGNNIETVGSSAFWLCTNLDSVVYSTGLKTLNAEAFKGCTALKNADLPEGVRTIDSFVFNGDTSITVINVPGTCREPGNSAFYNCKNVTSLTIGEGVTGCCSYTFYGLSSLKVLNLPKTFCNVDKSSFGACSSTEEINVAEGNPYIYVENGYLIGKQFHMIITGLGTKTAIDDIPADVTMLNWGCFNGMTNIKSVDLPKTVTDGGQETFKGCTGLESVKIGSGMNAIKQSMFQGCTSLKKLILPITITNIGVTAFYQCTSLEKVTIPNAVEALQSNCFSTCTSLTDLTLGMSLSSIQTKAFDKCPLAKITVLAEEPPTIGNENAFTAETYENAELIVPDDCLETYKAANIWSKFVRATISGINDNVADNTAAAVYYDLQGRVVANPSHGVYVKKQGANASKIIL